MDENKKCTMQIPTGISPAMTISDILLRNGTASLKDFYPLCKVKTESDKQMLMAKGYSPGYTVSEWPYALPANKIFYSRQLIPSTYYYDPNNATIPIALSLNIYGTNRLPTIQNDDAFCRYILDFAESLKQPTKDKLISYLLAQDDGLRSELLAEYIRRSEPSPELYELFITFYTITDYGAGVYDQTLLLKLFSGKSDAQKQATIASLSAFPDMIPIYRGEAEGSTPYHQAFSWSLDPNAAFFFACRHGDHNHARIIRAKVKKEDILEANLDSREREVIVLPGKPFDISKEKLIGPDSQQLIPYKFLDEYAYGKEQIKSLYLRQRRRAPDHQREYHDNIHSARVLFLALSIIQVGKIKLNDTELAQLSSAIVYHDIGRSNDEEDRNHGRASRDIYEKRYSDPVTGFLIEYHCHDDDYAENCLKTDPQIKNKKRAWLLYQILKDADALDRVRFGISNLDVSYLRLPISHKLVPLAVAAVTGIRI